MTRPSDVMLSVPVFCGSAPMGVDIHYCAKENMETLKITLCDEGGGFFVRLSSTDAGDDEGYPLDPDELECLARSVKAMCAALDAAREKEKP